MARFLYLITNILSIHTTYLKSLQQRHGLSIISGCEFTTSDLTYL